jgi:hypothetical protein
MIAPALQRSELDCTTKLGLKKDLKLSQIAGRHVNSHNCGTGGIVLHQQVEDDPVMWVIHFMWISMLCENKGTTSTLNVATQPWQQCCWIMKNKSMMTDPVLGSGMEELKQNPQQQGKLSDQSVGKNSRGLSSYQGCTLTSEQNPKSHREMVALERNHQK